MANGTVIIRGGQPIKWGTDGFMSAGTIVNSYDIGNKVETKEVKNNVGNVCSVVVYDTKQEISIEIVLDPTATAKPKAGNVIDAGTVKALVTAADESYQQDDAAVVKITATNWENVDLTKVETQGA